MKVLIYSINYSPELTGIGKYNGEMATWLAGQGHEVRVVTAPPYYPAWSVAADFRNKYARQVVDGVTVYRCPLYVPAEPRTLTRLLHLLSFALSSLLVLVHLLFWRPRLVFVVEPTLFCTPAALFYARMTGAKAVLHVQDYEVDAMLGLGLMSGGWIARMARSVESWLMRRFDRVSTISRSMMALAVNKGMSTEQVLFFPNWVDTNFISLAADKAFFRRKWGIPDSTRVLLYSGNMGKKQGLELVLQAAQALHDQRDLLFLMVGQGAARAELEQMTRDMALTNVRFEPLQSYEDLPALLALADVHLVIQKKGAADVVLPSKLTGILSAGGHALITAEPVTELGLLAAEFPGIATCVEPESLPALLDGLRQLLAVDTRQPNRVARDYAEQYLSQHTVLQRFEQSVQVLCR